ncbi:uncharacterized protein LOC134722812 [Mytilus trossulus]|uniref:uncharacterized protein LOC134722812 n=1 Tax=Mytilus trossulus TaxID=6551 RepID=UPI0030052C62
MRIQYYPFSHSKLYIDFVNHRYITMNDRKRKAEDIPFTNGNGVHVLKKNNSEVSLGQPVVEEEDLLLNGFPSTQESNYGGTGEQSWSADHLAQKLEEIGLSEVAKKFKGV